MASAATFGDLDSICVDVFGDTVVFAPADGSGPFPITAIFDPPSMMDEVMPQLGAAIVRLFVRLADVVTATGHSPTRGDTFQFNGYTYDLDDVAVDANGGATLRMRARSLN